MMTLTQYLLVKIAEEAAEVAQIALKTAHFGLNETQPGRDETNAQRLNWPPAAPRPTGRHGYVLTRRCRPAIGRSDRSASKC
ncbi:hypothetical protein [Burkholderia cenocepacia]|uniref:hypothetical protein n=1 Tax=Burkholderia cenocepacia TaxID=95486 RepID=UPI002AB6FB94|nr:hypothetical protein [Burkholderia cenocepacia]